MPVDKSSIRLLSLRGLSSRLVEARHLDDLLWRLARSLGEDFGFPDCVIYLRDGDELVQRAAFGPKNPTQRDIRDPIRIAIGSGITGTAASEARSLRLDDVRLDPRYIADVYSGLSELAVPIIYGDRVLGVIDSEADELAFYGEEEQVTLEIVANMVAPRIVSGIEQERRRLAESDLERSRARFLELAESIDGIVWEADAVTFDFRFVGQSAERLLGHPVSAWLGGYDRWLALVHPEDRGTALECRRRVAEGGSGQAAEYRMLGPEGRIIWVRDMVSAALLAGGAGGLCGVMVDVTEQRLAHERALAASHAKSEFLANMSHELRTPMNAIVGFTELLAEHALPPTSQTYLDLIARSASGLLGLFDDLLDLSRIEAGKVEIERRPFDLRQLVADILDVLRPGAEAKGLSMRLEIDASIPDSVLGDALRLRQILLNLVGNAIKFTDEGYVQLTASAGNPKVRIEVRDSGPGIPPDQVDAIFEKFWQVDSSSRRSHGGVGLGLAVCRQLAELMDGRIEVLPCTGGAAFELALPLPEATPAGPRAQGPLTAAAAADGAAADRAAADGAAGLGPFDARVLVVEDNPINQLVAQASLESLGCEVVVADGGEQALDHLMRGDGRFDLVFMDCQMPGLDGYETVRHLRRLPVSAAGVTIIAMTAHAMAGDREKCLAAGMDDYLAKPVRTEDLAAMLARHLAPGSQFGRGGGARE